MDHDGGTPVWSKAAEQFQRQNSRRAQDTEGTSNNPVPTAAEQSQPTTAAIDLICQTVQSAAQMYDLPQEFLTRLIWQESQFNPNAVSSKGAQGVAQFMPKTAAWVGLNNPWDPVEAITKSAQLLRDLKRQFGNLGLAAAAYNGGPKRVQDWVAGTRFLPRETQAYVRIVTGRSANEWTIGNPNPSLASRPDGLPCPELLKTLGNTQVSNAGASASPHRTSLH